MKQLLHEEGYARWPRTLDRAALAGLDRLFARLAADRPGVRIDAAACNDLAAVQDIRPDVEALLGRSARPVRALLFDKRDGANWALGWHQDRTIEVAERIEVPGFGPWTCKQDRLHVAPPIELLERMLTVRIHLDAVPPDNAPLRVAPGSHRLGCIAEDTIDDVVAACGVATCLADVGSVWFYATPILHGSARAASGGRRRVLQLEFAAEDLPGGLRWAAQRRLRVAEVSPKPLTL
ncbi:ectoine hydroxylase-related dioxygenase (phytanoyl-CoA dioxygenase family) [Sphingomonas insulae]|uniref:Phytanoyl-CoA dioxygenase n=1 Tax=Sphingomonas insulae TaxID=424800 RepID=A0ABN1HRA9_9SPHN|nr:phytanoyl-CoA dioxygenase family protein [Sphingomonas insulae]NIJ29279.1 ectoine hydroxylase-related dioxygenase (phytanoyl-CoA dioxygenase family) [Sphingomonas insulae]